MELSHRQIQVLRRMACGQSNAEIALALGLRPNTICNYVTQINMKLGVSVQPRVCGRILTIRAALKERLIPMPRLDESGERVRFWMEV